MSGREARVSQSGAAVFLTADDLADLGIDAAETQEVRYEIVDGCLRLEEAAGGS